MSCKPGRKAHGMPYLYLEKLTIEAAGMVQTPHPEAVIREETPADYDAIRQVNRLAFKQESEARLVDQLRADSDVVASLVAVNDDQVVGHIMFSKLPIETDGEILRGAALAPMAARPDLQRQGIGAALVKRGIEVCRDRGYVVIVVLGDPVYYARFGFSAERATRLRCPYSGEALMALELTEGVLKNGTGSLVYPDAFSLVE